MFMSTQKDMRAAKGKLVAITATNRPSLMSKGSILQNNRKAYKFTGAYTKLGIT